MHAQLEQPQYNRHATTGLQNRKDNERHVENDARNASWSLALAEDDCGHDDKKGGRELKESERCATSPRGY